jgi:D-glycero-alpha-D-manno-heptose-7-phosphate kinase
MIITRTPYRISFFGGGTDYPGWFHDHGGAVLSTTIDKYCYISCRKLPPFFDHKHRIVYSIIENVLSNEEILHPSARAVFQWAGVDEGLEIHHDGDLPARSGIGSSSSFTVGLIQAIYALRSRLVSQEQLARDAIHVEQDLIGENVGSQDQIAAAYGGFNKITFHQDGHFAVNPVILSIERRQLLESHLMLCFTGVSRIADKVARSQIDNLPRRQSELKAMQAMVDDAISILSNERADIREFGRLLDASWRYKRSLSDQVSTPHIDALYQTAFNHGAIGGKILGAGGGAFF